MAQKKRKTSWSPPRGMTVVHRLKKPNKCRICKRPLSAGDTVLAWKTTKGPVRAFACVDVDDCKWVVKFGGWPDAQPRIERYAADLDRIRSFA